MANIIDDKYDDIDVDIERVQTKPTMYISFLGPAGVEHLAHEITNNIIDEHENPNSISDGTSVIHYDATENMIAFSDTGRGIPFEVLETTCTILHAGSKMNRDNGATAGENGVGLTVTNALSEIFEITSTRNGMSKYLRFENGVKVDDKEIKIKNKDKHGLLVSFKPSQMFLGKDAVLPVDSFMEWLQEQSFMLPEDLSITFTCDGLPGKIAPIRKVYKNNKGVVGYLEYKFPKSNLLSKPIEIHDSVNVVEEDVPVRQEDGTFALQNMDRVIKLHVAFNFDPKQTEPQFNAFCNNIKNTEGGQHQDAVKSAISGFFLKKANEAKKKKSKTEYTMADVTSGLNCVLNMETTVSTAFESQTKLKLGNKYFYAPVRKMAISALEKMFNMPENKSILNKIVNYIKFNAQLRMEQINKRNKVPTTAPTFMDCKLITGYIPPNLIHLCYEDGIELEIYIVEGDSPGGQVRKARYSNDVQGVLKLKGKPTKIWMRTPSWLDANPGDMVAVLLRDVLGCGWGKHFDISKLRYKRIIFSPDADIDGDHITSLLLADIYRVAPQLIEQGYCYRVVYPLYKLMEKRKKNSNVVNRDAFIYSKVDLYDKFEQTVAQNVRLKFNVNDAKYITPQEMKGFLSTNREYYEVINEMSKYMVHPDIIEFVASNPDYKTTISQLDEELYYDESNGEVGEIMGDYKRESYSLTLDDLTLKKINYLSDVINAGNNGMCQYELYEKRSSGDYVHLGKKTIYQIMNFCQKYAADIDARYKGLGELESIELKELAMNPKNRVLVQFTVADSEKLINKLDILFNDNQRDARKDIIRGAKISIDEIDN